MNTFERLNLSSPILQALKGKGYIHPTAVQTKAIPLVLEGHDIFGSAQTGTGKTAAFALPVLQLLSHKTAPHPRALILAPTRELAIQIGKSFQDYGKHIRLRQVIIYGGVSQRQQTSALRQGVDIVIATPGRLLDLMNQGHISLDKIQYLVLDEADRMMDMGFLPDITRILSKVPKTRQTLFFSATLPGEIRKLAATLLKNPVTVSIPTEVVAKAMIEEKVYFINKNEKADLLCQLMKSEKIDQALVFTRTKRGAEKLAKLLNASGIRAQSIHGDKSQSQRERALEAFKHRKVKVLVATDVASRGIDVKELSHVINFDLPEQSESYTHRIGRTGRAGANGTALSFCSNEEKSYLKNIQRSTGTKIPVGSFSLTKKAG